MKQRWLVVIIGLPALLAVLLACPAWATMLIVCGIAGLMVSYYLGTSTGASITLLLAVWFFVTLLVRRAH